MSTQSDKSNIDVASCSFVHVPMMLAAIAAFVCSVGGVVYAANGHGDVERSMTFVDKSMKATELFNAGQSEKALPIFRDLAVNYSDLDKDGFAAMSLGDCLAALGRNKEARDAYAKAVAAHQELVGKLGRRLTELELAGDVTPELIDRLRIASQTENKDQLTAYWDLGRALQKRARTLLDDAAVAFLAAADSPMAGCGAQDHLTTLKELSEDLSLLIDRLEERWGKLRGRITAAVDTLKADEEKAFDVEGTQFRWTTRTMDGKLVALSFEAGKSGAPNVTVGDTAVKLSPQEKSLIERHQSRITAILLEAAKKATKTDG